MMTDRAHNFEDHSALKRYSSFLLRCWHVGESELRIKLEHVQSGEVAQVEAWAAALDWMSGRCCESSNDVTFTHLSVQES